MLKMLKMLKFQGKPGTHPLKKKTFLEKNA